jgi:hypothetical protein
MTGGLGNRYCMPIAKRCRGYRRNFSCQAFVESIKQFGLANKILDRPASRSNHAGRSTSGKATAAFGQPLDFPTWADHAVVSAAATGRGQNAAPAPAKPSKMKQSRDGENMFERPYADWHIDS